MSFRLKLTAWIIVLQAVFLSFFSLYMARHTFNQEFERLEEEAKMAAMILEGGIVGSLIAQDFSTVFHAVTQMVGTEHVDHVQILDSQGRIVVSYGTSFAGDVRPEMEDHSPVVLSLLQLILGRSPTVDQVTQTINTPQGSIGLIKLTPEPQVMHNALWAQACTYMAASVAGCILTALAGWMAGAIIGSRIEVLTAGARKIANGDFQHRLVSVGKDEVAEIAHAMNSMADALIEGRRTAECQARSDALTGLSNRVGLAEVIALNNRRGRALTVLHIDLDRFKLINDTRGHAAGDAVLCAFSERLTAVARQSKAVARVGGDEFIVFMTTPVNHDLPMRIAEEIVCQAQQPISYNGTQLRIGASVGIASLPPGPHEPDAIERLLTDADIALFQAKTSGRGCVARFDEDARAAREAEADLEIEITEALQQAAFVPFIQPQVDLATGEIIGAEILARWEHPHRGTLTPRHFFEKLRNHELAEAIDAQVRRRALRWMADEAKTRPLTISVNLTPELLSRNDTAALLCKEFSDLGVAADRVIVEVHENVILDAEGVVLDNLEALLAAGHRLELDDFGTGNASLQNLMHLNVDTLKVDRSFIQTIDTDKDRQAILQAIIGIGRSMGVGVLAEGVETVQERDMLLKLGCTAFQGFLFARPMPLAEFDDWVATHWAKYRNSLQADIVPRLGVVRDTGAASRSA